jgi:flagellar basal-body rod protein FlgB
MNTDSIFGIHIQAVRVRGERAEILARNMANADTPGYKARDMNFQDLISKESSSSASVRTTHPAHMAFGSGSTGGHNLQYRSPQQASMDGNTVDMQTERAEFMRNALMYQTSLQFLNGRINGLMTAIRGE